MVEGEETRPYLSAVDLAMAGNGNNVFPIQVTGRAKPKLTMEAAAIDEDCTLRVFGKTDHHALQATHYLVTHPLAMPPPRLSYHYQH